MSLDIIGDPTYAVEYEWPRYYVTKQTPYRSHSYVAPNGHRYGVDRDFVSTQYLSNLDSVEEGAPMFIDVDEGAYLESFATLAEAEVAFDEVLLLVSPEVD